MWTRPFVDKLKSSKPDRFFMQLLTQGETKWDTVNFLCEEKRKERKTILPEWIIRLKSLHLAKLFSFQTFKFFLLIRELVTENGALPPWDIPAGIVVECIILGLLDWTFVLMDTIAMIPWIDNMGSLSHRCKALIIIHLAISILTSNFVVLCKVCYHFGPIHFLNILSPNLADIFFITFSTQFSLLKFNGWKLN